MINNFKRQQRDILTVVDQVINNLDYDKVQEEPAQMLKLISKLSGSMSGHLALENRLLYPKLIKDSNRRVRRAAEEYINESKDLNEIMESYDNKWVDEETLRTHSFRFIAVTEDLCDLLIRKMNKKNERLYTLLS